MNNESTASRGCAKDEFYHGRTVDVAERTWPGINKLGGVGRVTGLHYAEDGQTVTHLDVVYTVVGGREKRIPIEYVAVAPQYEGTLDGMLTDNAPSSGWKPLKTHLRDRSLMLGRCKRCGSLRTDCGSCDWIEQERQAGETVNQLSKSKAPVSDNSATQRLRIRKRQRTSVTIDSSSDDDLLNDIKHARLRHQRYLREKAQWHRIVRDSSSSDSSRSEVDNADEKSSSEGQEDEDDDPILVQLAQLSGSRRNADMTRLETRYACSSGTTSTRTRDVKLRQSSLERLSKANKDGTFVLSSRKEQSSDESLNPKAPSLQPNVTDEAYDTDACGDQDFSPLSQPQPLDIRDEAATKGCTRESYEMGYTSDPGLDLEGFIQPEGSQALEHLPEDTFDMTLTIPYGALPAFFDRLAAKIQDEDIPDGKLQLAELQRRSNKAKTTSDASSLKILEKESTELFGNLRQRLIREGVDQCQAALRRLIDRRQYRLHKNTLTPSQRKDCRGTALEARDMVLDELGMKAEGVLRTAKDIINGYSDWIDESEVANDDFSVRSSESNSTAPSGTTSDLDAAHFLGSYRRPRTDETTTLPPFDPHAHARLVRPTISKAGRASIALSSHGHGATRTMNAHRKSRNDAIPNKSSLDPKRRQVGTVSSRKERFDEECNNSNGEVESKRPLYCRSTCGDNRKSDAPPSLESVLLSNENTAAAYEQGIRSHRSRVPIAARMQAFLDANASIVDNHALVVDRLNREDKRKHKRSSPHIRVPRIQVSTRDRERGHKRFLVPLQADNTEAPGFTKSVCDISGELSLDSLYSALIHQGRSPVEQSPPCPTIDDLSAICQSLVEHYPQSSDFCLSVFARIEHHLEREGVVTATHAPDVFKVVLNLLQNKGRFLLQEIIACKPDLLRLHVRLLTFTLGLLEKDLHLKLSPDDGLVYSIFGKGNSIVFVEWLVLQILDAAYAQVHPMAWGYPLHGNGKALDELVALRDALRKCCSLTEIVSRFVIERLEIQKWWRLDNKSNIFVSAVDPSAYNSFLVSGETYHWHQRIDVTRYSQFKGSLPRIEIDAIWSILAFLAGSSKLDDCTSLFRWRLVGSLFYSETGVLAKGALEPTNEAMARAPPSTSHLTSCQAELRRLTTLLMAGVMDPLPSSDGIITKLIEKSIVLQADEYKYSESAIRIIPACPEKIERVNLLSAWRRTDVKTSPTPTLLTMQNKGGPEMTSNFCDQQDTCVYTSRPVSEILRCNTALLVAWMLRLPDKKARWSRYKTSLQNLVNTLLERSDLVQQQNLSGEEQNANLSFQDVFSSNKQNIGGGFAKAALFLKESAVRLMLAESVTRALRDKQVIAREGLAILNPETREKVWMLMSDEVMRRRQHAIVEPSVRAEKTADAYRGDGDRLLVAARVIALLANFQWGIYPNEMKQIFEDGYSEHPVPAENDENVLVFLMSCFSACLDCSFDIFEQSSPNSTAQTSLVSFDSQIQVVTYICMWMCEMCLQARLVLEDQVSKVLASSVPAEKLGKCVLEMVVGPLERCLRCITRSSDAGGHTDDAFRATLTAVRAVIGLTMVAGERTIGFTTDNGRPLAASVADGAIDPERRQVEDESLGSMDDAFFLSIELDRVEAQVHEGDKTMRIFRNLWDTLISTLEQAKPSMRFAVLDAAALSRAGTCLTSVQGRVLAAKHAGGICACLAALTALRNQDFEFVSRSLSSFFLPFGSQQATGDRMFNSHIAQCFYSEVCNLSQKFPQCDRHLANQCKVVMFRFLEAMLDSSTLERFPTINLERMKLNGGLPSEEREAVRLALAGARSQRETSDRQSDQFFARKRKNEVEDSPGPIYNSINIWRFCRNLGLAVVRLGIRPSGDGGDGSHLSLLDADADLPVKPPTATLLVSLESECMRRITLIRSMLSLAVVNQVHLGGVNYETVACSIIASCTNELLSISESLLYCVRTHVEVASRKSYKHAKLLELQSCYVELTITSMSWILRESNQTHSDTFEALLGIIRDNLFARVLQKHDFDVCTVLRQIHHASIARQVKYGERCSSKNSSDQNLLRDLFHACIRRSRELLLHVASRFGHQGPVHTYCLHNALLAAGLGGARDDGENEATAEIVINAFQHGIRMMTFPFRFNRSRFQESIDSYIEFVNSSRTIERTEIQAFQRLKQSAIEKFLLPKLTHKTIDAFKELGALRMLHHFLHEDTKRFDLYIRVPLDQRLVCSIAKALASCFCDSIESLKVDDDVVGTILACAKHLMNVPAPSMNDEGELTVLRWSHSWSHSSDLASDDYGRGSYLCAFAKWMFEMGSLLVGHIDEGRRLNTFRYKATRLKAQKQTIWCPGTVAQSLDDTVLESWVLMKLLESRLVFDEVVQPVTNVYAKPGLSNTKGSHDENGTQQKWEPSSSVRRCAKELMADVIAIM